MKGWNSQDHCQPLFPSLLSQLHEEGFFLSFHEVLAGISEETSLLIEYDGLMLPRFNIQYRTANADAHKMEIRKRG